LLRMRCMLLQEPAAGRIEGHPVGLAQQVLAGVPRCLAALTSTTLCTVPGAWITPVPAAAR
jgi:hypothetical protein